MAYQKRFWKGQIERANGREDKIRGNPEAPNMHQGPGDFDADIPDGADASKRGSSQPKSGNPGSGELPLKHAHTKPRRQQMQQVMRAQALRSHSANGTTTAAIGGGAAGGGAGE